MWGTKQLLFIIVYYLFSVSKVDEKAIVSWRFEKIIKR
jgi:hypothetical protein